MSAMQTTTTPPATATPRKSRRRWYVLGFLLLVAATPVAWYVIAGWLAEREMATLLAEIDAEDPGWQWPDLAGKLEPIPADANSATQIAKVNALARTPVVFNPGPKWDDAKLIQNARLTDDQANALQTTFGRCDPTLRDEARKLKDMPRGRFSIPADGNPFAHDWQELQGSRTVVYVLQCDAALRAHDGDLDGAAESCQAMLNTAGAFKDHPSLIGYLVRLAEQAIAINSIERVLGQGTVSEPHLKKLQELLQREADDDGMHAAMRGERASSHQMFSKVRDGKTTISQMFGNGGNKGGLIEPGVTGWLLDAFPNVILKDYPDYLRAMNERVDVCKLEPGPRNDALQNLDEGARTKGNLLTRMMLPAVEKVSQASLRSQAYLRCSTVAVAAERYRLSHDAWPRTLDDLVKDGLLAKIPSDPYDGKPLRWKRTPTGATVYSVGRDRIDNGGNLNRANMMADGADFGFELWDSPRMRGVPAPVEAP
jgi:hypothetical protein